MLRSLAFQLAEAVPALYAEYTALDASKLAEARKDSSEAAFKALLAGACGWLARLLGAPAGPRRSATYCFSGTEQQVDAPSFPPPFHQTHCLKCPRSCPPTWWW
jgi:hypothetical protein